MTSSGLVSQLQEFFRDKLAERNRHVAGAELVQAYENNNAYQYIVNRDETQLAWLRQAIESLGAEVPSGVETAPPPREGKGDAAERAVIADDVRRTQAFHDKWKARAASLPHARHRRMLEVVLGEAMEQKRFFEQMLENREDVLGRRQAHFSTGGGVLATRWLE